MWIATNSTVEGNMWSSRSRMRWSNAAYYCNHLTECGYSDWRLPNINELRTLIKNCPSAQTGGSCAVKDPDCLSWDYCYSDDDCHNCEYKENNGGYYSKLGDDNFGLVSSSVMSDRSSENRWCVSFREGAVTNGTSGHYGYVRCIRNAD